MEERRQLLLHLLSGLQTAESEDSEFFVRMFEHEFGDDPPWRRPQRPRDLALVLSDDRLGAAEDQDFGQKLMQDMLVAMAERQSHPKYVVLLNRGVYLAIRDADALPALKKMEARGSRVLVSKASLEHFDKADDLRLGEAVSMLQIVDTLYEVEKVLNF